MTGKTFRDVMTQAQINKVNILAVLIPTFFMVGYLFNRTLKFDEARFHSAMSDSFTRAGIN